VCKTNKQKKHNKKTPKQQKIKTKKPLKYKTLTQLTELLEGGDDRELSTFPKCVF